MDEDGVLGRIEDRAIARFRYPQRFCLAHPLRNVMAQSCLCLGDIERHGVECAAQSTELVGPLEIASSGQIARCDLFSGAYEPRGASRQQEVKHEPHCQRERRDPPRPIERLLNDLRSRFRLVALEVVSEEHAADP